MLLNNAKYNLQKAKEELKKALQAQKELRAKTKEERRHVLDDFFREWDKAMGESTATTKSGILKEVTAKLSPEHKKIYFALHPSDTVLGFPEKEGSSK